MEGIICNTCLTQVEIKRLKTGMKLLLHTKEGYCSLLAEVLVVGSLGAVGCEVKIEEILDYCTENTSKEGDIVWANFRDLAIIN